MGLIDNIRSEVEQRKNSWEKGIEKKQVTLIKEMREEVFNPEMVLEGNLDELESEISRATKELNQAYHHNFSPQVTALLWLEFIEGNDEHLNHILQVTGRTAPRMHDLEEFGEGWRVINRLRKYFNQRMYLQEINTYKSGIQIVEEFNLKDLEHNKDLDADDIEALALFMELPEFAAKFAEEDSKNREQDAEKLEQKIDAWVVDVERRHKKKLERAKKDREKAKKMFDNGLIRLSENRGIPRQKVEEAVKGFERDLDDWSVSQPFSSEKFNNLIGERYYSD